jgi:archaellum component FlaC
MSLSPCEPFLQAYSVGYMTTEQYQEIINRFDGIDQRFEGVEGQFVGINQRFSQIDQRFDKIDRRFDSLDETVKAIDIKIDDVKEEVMTFASDIHDHLSNRIEKVEVFVDMPKALTGDYVEEE